MTKSRQEQELSALQKQLQLVKLVNLCPFAESIPQCTSSFDGKKDTDLLLEISENRVWGWQSNQRVRGELLERRESQRHCVK